MAKARARSFVVSVFSKQDYIRRISLRNKFKNFNFHLNQGKLTFPVPAGPAGAPPRNSFNPIVSVI